MRLWRVDFISWRCYNRRRGKMNKLARELVFKSEKRFQLVRGDITEEHVDAIVNAAYANLQHGDGVAGVMSLN